MQQPTYLVNLLSLDHPFSNKHVPNTKLNIGKRAFSVAAANNLESTPFKTFAQHSKY